jgi:hypothetical protein
MIDQLISNEHLKILLDLLSKINIGKYELSTGSTG